MAVLVKMITKKLRFVSTDDRHHRAWNEYAVEIGKWNITNDEDCANAADACIGMAEDIAPLAVYLASDESSFVNSASIIIDGGVCLGWSLILATLFCKFALKRLKPTAVAYCSGL